MGISSWSQESMAALLSPQNASPNLESWQKLFTSC